MKAATQRTHFVAFAVFVTIGILWSCSGGGGEGGADGGLHRSRNTALRIIHGSLDESPVSIALGPQVLQTARFGESTFYVSAPEGAANILMHRANAPGEILAQIPASLGKDTEYTVLLTGNSRDDTQRARLITDQVTPPEAGRSLVRFVNAFQDSGQLTLSVSGTEIGSASVGGATSFIEIPAGIQRCQISRSGGAGAASLDVDFLDRGEITIAAIGSRSVGSFFTAVYQDLD